MNPFARLRVRPIRAFSLVVASLLVVPGVGVRAQGAAQAWGYNRDGELGNGTTAQSSVPTAVSGLGGGVTAVAAGDSHSLGIQNGTLYAWGSNRYGQLGNGTTADSLVPVAVPGMTGGVTAAAGGRFHSLAVRNGALYAWGSGNPTPVAVSGLDSGVTLISAGNTHDLAVCDGALYAWGSNGYGQLGNGTTTSSATPTAVIGLDRGVTAVAAGVYHSLAIQNGALYAWGYNGAGQVGNGNTANQSAPVPLGLPGTATNVGAGGSHSLAVVNGGVYAWGQNGNGQLGNGTTTNSTTPVRVDPANLQDIRAVAGGDASSYALAGDGSLWVWGFNNFGELGLGTNTSQYNTPQHLLPPAGYVYTGIDGDAYGVHVLAVLSPMPARVLGVGRSTDGHFVLQAAGAPGVTYTVRAAPDLVAGNFVAVGTVTADAVGTLRYDDAGAAGQEQRFYRVTYP